jgi:hypothetical protein
MAKGPGPQQRFPSNIIRIAFAAAGGLVYFHWDWKSVSDSSSPPADPNPLFDFANSVIQTPNLHMWTDSPVARLAVPMSKDEAKRSVPVRNPVTVSMLPHYSMWTPENAPKYRIATTISSPAGDIYIIDKANWNLVYAAHITSKLIGPYSAAQALAIYQGLIGTTGYEDLDPTKMGVSLEQVFYNGAFQDLPPFPDPLTISVFASSGWQWHTEPGTTKTQVKVDGTANLILNLAQLRVMMKKANQKDKKVTFNIVIPADKQIGSFKMEAQAFSLKDGPRFDKKKQTYDFPVDATNVPQWPEWAGEKVAVNANASTDSHTIKVTITFASRDKGKDTPPKVEMEMNGDITPTIG